MTENILTTNPDKSEPKYRKKLNEEQLAVLNLLYTFRFASNEHVAKYSGKKNNKHVQKRLKILEDQEYIAKRYDKSYKLKGKPAAYYLLPKGARALVDVGDRDNNEPTNIKRIYKDKDVSEGFIEHSLNILGVYLALSALHGNKLDFFTKSDLKYEQFDFYPQPLPDAMFALALKTVTRTSFSISLKIPSRSLCLLGALRSTWNTLAVVSGPKSPYRLSWSLLRTRASISDYGSGLLKSYATRMRKCLLQLLGQSTYMTLNTKAKFGFRLTTMGMIQRNR